MSDQSPSVGAWYTSVYDYKANGPGELSFGKNEHFQLMRVDNTWWMMKSESGSIGSAPATFFSRYRGPRVNTQNGGDSSAESYAIAVFPYASKLEDELTLNVRDKIRILDRADDGWWYGSLAGKNGWFPNNFVKEIVSEAASPSQKYFIHGVKAKYNFDSGNPDELSFVPGEVMDIIDKPQLDQDWWEAMKADGSVGLIPYNYVYTLENSTPVCAPLPPGKPDSPPTGDQDIVTQPFYHKIQRVQAETLLKSRAGNGDFVVREATREGCYSLSVMAPDRIKHFQIEKNDKGEYSIGPRVFNTFQELYEHYRANPILTAANGDKFCLQHGIPSS